MTDTNDIIEQCTDFLSRSSRRYSSTLMRATKDMRRYSGDFWDDDFKKQYRKGKNRTYLQLNNWNVMCNAIAHPYQPPLGIRSLKTVPTSRKPKRRLTPWKPVPTSRRLFWILSGKLS